MSRVQQITTDSITWPLLDAPWCNMFLVVLIHSDLSQSYSSVAWNLICWSPFDWGVRFYWHLCVYLIVICVFFAPYCAPQCFSHFNSCFIIIFYEWMGLDLDSFVQNLVVSITHYFSRKWHADHTSSVSKLVPTYLSRTYESYILQFKRQNPVMMLGKCHVLCFQQPFHWSSYLFLFKGWLFS